MHTERTLRIKRCVAVLLAATLILLGVCSALFVGRTENAYATDFSSNPSAAQKVGVTSDSGTTGDEELYKEFNAVSYYTAFTGASLSPTAGDGKSGEPFIAMKKTSQNGAYIYSRNNYMSSSAYTRGEMIVTDCTESDSFVIFSDVGGALVMTAVPQASGAPCDLNFTFALSDELRKVLKDKMLVVTATPYVVTAGSNDVKIQFGSANLSDFDSSDLNLFMYDGTDAPVTEPTEPPTSIRTISTKDYVQLPVEDGMALGSSGSIASGEYGDNAFLQVTLCNWTKNGDDFTVAIREVGVRITVTFNSSVSIATVSGTGNPSSNPGDLNKVTTCIVQGEDRHASAPSTSAKKGDVLDVNLVLIKDTTVMSLDTGAYSATEPAFEDCKDGTMFRRLFLTEDDEFLISWAVTDGSIEDGSAAVDSTNKSGQAIKFKVNTGGSASGKLVLQPSISYRNRETGVLTKINNNRTISVSVTVDSNAPNAPTLDNTGNYYKKYLDENSTFYTTVQTSMEAGDRDDAGNVVRLLLNGGTNSNRPLFTEKTLDNAGGSDSIIYYKTTYIGDEVPGTTAEMNSVPFTGPVYVETAAGSKTYVAYEGKLSRDVQYYKMVIEPNSHEGTAVTKDKYYVRNNLGQYVLTTDTVFVYGTNYYTCEAYDYETAGEFTGIYARVGKDLECEYGNIYVNTVIGTTAEGKDKITKAGVWAIEFITYDLVGQSTMCASKYFVKVDITDYEFEVQFALGSDFEQTELNSDNIRIWVATVDEEGKESAYTEAETVDSGEVQRNIFRLRRANRVSVRVEFKDSKTFSNYVLTKFAVGNIGFSTSTYTYTARKTDLDYMFFNVTTGTTTKRAYYTFDVDASYCMDENLRRMQFTFKRTAEIVVTNYVQTYDGTSKEITTSVPKVQNEGQTANVVTKYYTTDIYEDEYLVKYGENNSNIPVDAGTYYYFAEIVNHGTYYGKATGTLTINKKQPSLTTVAVSGINYGDGLGKIDFNPDNRNSSGQQLPSNGIYAVINEGGREYFLSTMSSDKIPGYYEIVFDDKTSEDYLSPQAGELTITLRFTPVQGTVAGQEVTYKYDDGGNFIPDPNYEVVSCDRTITIVHDDKVLFALEEVQEGGNGVVKQTTMATTVETLTLDYVEFTYSGLRRTIEYTLVSSYEKDEDDPSVPLDLKGYATVSFAKADSLTLSQRQLTALRYGDVSPSEAGIYAVRVKLDESRCNYSKEIYTYIHIKKIVLSVNIEASDAVFDYQYESTPAIDVRYGVTDYNNVVEGFIYEYFYYESGKTLAELTDENNRVSDNDLRSYTGNPVTAGEYYLKVSIDDPNYEGIGYVRYRVKPVDNGNQRFKASWPGINGSQLNPQYHISYGQPVKEIGLGTNASFTYPYRSFGSSGSTTTTTRTVAGKVYVVSVKYTEWLAAKGLENSDANRNAYLKEMSEATPDYSLAPYGWYLCFSAETEGSGGERIFDGNFDFIYENADIYVGKAELDWTNVTVSPITFGDAVENDGDLTVSRTLGILYSVSGNIPDGDYYVRNVRYVYRYVEAAYTYALTDNKPNVSAAGTVNIEVKAVFTGNENFRTEYVGGLELVINKKNLTVSYVYDDGNAYADKVYRAFDETEFYSRLEYVGFVGDVRPTGLIGSFEYVRNETVVAFSDLTAGDYTVRYTLNHANYSGYAEFALKINPSALSVGTAPELAGAEVNVVYNAKVVTSVGFLGGRFIAQGGETVSYTAGTVAAAGRMGVFSSTGTLLITDVTSETTFGAAGTRVRIYYNFLPADSVNYSAFEGTDENGGYIDVTVGKADVSENMSLSLKRGEYIYKDVIYTDAELKNKVVEYSLSGGLDLGWVIGIVNSRGETPSPGNYLNAGEYVVKVIIEDDNYGGEASCALTIRKKDAFVVLKSTANSSLETKDGVIGVKKQYKGNALNIDFDVYEKDERGGLVTINEAAVVTFYSDGVKMYSAPSEIGFYTAEISLSSSVNYALCDSDTGERIAFMESFLTIGVDLSVIELLNIEQVYTVQKTVSVFMGSNDAVCRLTYEKGGVSYKELPIEAGTYDIYLNFAAYENNGYEDKINALEITDGNGVSRGYRLVISQYYTEITAPESVTVAYTGEEIERFAPYTSPYGLALEYYYKAKNGGEYALSTLSGLGALDAGEYDVKIVIADKNYRGEKIISYTVNKARLTEKTSPSFGEYEYNTEFAPEYVGGGSFVFGSTEIAGEFIVPLSGIRTLPVGEHTVTYEFIPDSGNFLSATGTVKLKVVRQVLGQDFLTLGAEGNLLSDSDYVVEYNNTRYNLKVNYDSSKIYGYPQENGDFTVNLKYTANGTQQSPLAIGAYTVTAEVSAKNYSCVKTWEYKLVITTGTPIIVALPQATRTFAIGETVTGADFTGGKAVIDSAAGTEIFGTFTLNENVVLRSANTNRFAMTFTPTDTDNFKSVAVEVTAQVVGRDPMKVDGVALIDGKTAAGGDWTNATFFPTFLPTGGDAVYEGTHENGYCGAKIRIYPKSGAESAEYGSAQGAFAVEFVCAHDGCAECEAAVERLNDYGTLAFEGKQDYVPSVGEKLAVTYKLRVESVEDAAVYNNMYGYVSASGIIVKKNLTSANSDFEMIKLADGKGFVLTIYEKNGQQFAFIASVNGTVTSGGAFREDAASDIDISVVFDGLVATVQAETKNYFIAGFTMEAREYTFVEASDFNVGVSSKTYDGKPVSAEDMLITVTNTQLPVSEDAFTIEIYDEDGNLSAGTAKGVYTVSVYVKDDRNRYYGFLETEFIISERDVSAELYLIKAKETVAGEVVYYDGYGSGSHTTITVGLDGAELPKSAYKTEIKFAAESDDRYTSVGLLGAGTYTVKVTVSATDYRGEAVFVYRVDPQKITMILSDTSFTVDYGSSEHNSFAIAPTFKDESGDNFTFEGRGGYVVSYYSSGYPKQTNKPVNAGEYTITVEANNANYRIVNGTVQYTIKPRATRVATAPTPIAIDENGNNLIYGQKLSLLGLSTNSAAVTDSSGNYISGTFAVKSSEADIVPGAGQTTVTLVFTPSNKNYASAETTITIGVAKKTVRIEFENLSAFYNGSSRRNELSFKALSDPITVTFEFVNATGQVVEPVTAGIYNIRAIVNNGNYSVEMSAPTGGTESGTPIFTIKRAEVNKELAVNPVASSVGVGESLNKSSLSGGRIYYRGFSDPIKGSFSYVEGGRAYTTAGTYTVEYMFIPDDNANFASFRGTVEIVVGRGTATVTPGENVSEYGTAADFTALKFTTSPAGMNEDIRFEFVCDGKTYKQGDILPAGTYWFTCWIDGANYRSERTAFSYVVNKKEIDIDFIDANGTVVTAYTTGYGESAFIDVMMYDANTSGKKTYLLKDAATMKKNIEYRYVSRGETAAYDGYNAPTAIGSYDLTVTIKHDNYVATKTVIYRVTTGKVTDIVFDVDTLINQTYGAVVPPIVTTSPANVSYYIIYQGYNTTLPTAVGSYNVTVYIDDANYASTQMSAVFRINPKPLEITGITVKDKAYDGVASLEITGSLTGVLYNDEVKLDLSARTYNGAIDKGEHFVEITECKLSGLHASNYTLTDYPVYEGKIRIYENIVKDSGGNSYIISENGFAEGTSITFREVNTARNATSIWTRMLGVEATVTAYTIKVNNADAVNGNQYKICVEIPEKYRNVDFTVEFDGALKGQPISYTREGNYISFYASTASGEIVFQNAEFKYGYVVTAAILLIILIAVVVLFILNPMQHRRSVTDPRAAKDAVKRIKRENRR